MNLNNSQKIKLTFFLPMMVMADSLQNLTCECIQYDGNPAVRCYQHPYVHMCEQVPREWGICAYTQFQVVV